MVTDLKYCFISKIIDQGKDARPSGPSISQYVGTRKALRGVRRREVGRLVRVVGVAYFEQRLNQFFFQ